MERQALALKTAGQGALAAAGILTLLYLVVVSDYSSVTDVVALLLLVSIPTAVAVDAARTNLAELQADGD